MAAVQLASAAKAAVQLAVSAVVAAVDVTVPVQVPVAGTCRPTMLTGTQAVHTGVDRLPIGRLSGPHPPGTRALVSLVAVDVTR